MATLESSPKNATSLKNTFHICNAVMAAFLLYAALASLTNAVRLARVPFQLDYEEGNVLNAGVRINAGLTPYAAAGSWPVVLNPYGPIPYHITAFLIRSVPPSFFLPRIAIAASAALIAILVGLITYRFTKSWRIAVSFGAVFLTLPLAQEWMPVLRVDFMGLAFSLLGLCLFLSARWLKHLAVLFFAGAFFCKVTFVAAPLACAAVLIKQKRWRELAYMTVGGVVLLAAALALLRRSTHGAFLFHQFGTHVDPWSWGNYSRHTLAVLAESSVLVALALCGIIRLRRFDLPLAYLLMVGVGTITLFKAGSESNHLLELEAALCISAGLGMQQLQTMRSRAAVVLVVIVGSVLVVTAMQHRARYRIGGLVEQCPQAYAYIQNHQAVLSENVGALVLTGKPVLLSNPFVYAQLVRSGKWPNGKIEEMLQERSIDLVMIGKPAIMQQRWSQAALAALAANYHPTRQFVCPDAAIAYEPGPKD